MAKRRTTSPPADEPTVGVVSDPRQNYVASSVDNPYYPGHRILPQSIDDLERDVASALKIYEEMANDPMLGGATEEIKISVLEDGWRVQGAVKKPVKRQGVVDEAQQAEFDKSEEVRQYVEWNLRTLCNRSTAFVDVCWDMLSAIYMGHRVAEWTVEVAKTGPYKGGEILKCLKVKNRRNYAFAMTSTNDVVGVVARIAGKGYPLRTGIVYDAKQLPNAIDPSKFWVLTIGAKEGDPRGTSQYRKCYAPWYEKQTLRPARLKDGVQHGGGKITVELGETTPNFVQFYDDTTGKSEQLNSFVAAQRMAMQLSNGRVGVFPNGCKVTIHPPAGSSSSQGGGLSGYIDACDREMVYALKKQLRQTMEAKHGSKADSQTAENIADKVTNWLRSVLSGSFWPVMYMLTLIRFGEDEADKYCPTLTFSSSSTGDLSKNLEAHSKAGYKYHKSQFDDIDAEIGAPERDEDWANEEEPDENNPDEPTPDPGS